MASTSSYRRALLARVLNDSFRCEAPGVDETRQEHEMGLAMVTRLALAKARTVAARHPRAWVIGSDQAAILQDDGGEVVLGKPGSAERCAQALRRCSGATIAYRTGVAVVRQSEGSAYEFMDTTLVKFRELDETTIERYVAREAPFDCAGGFKSEGLGISLCDSIASEDPTALIGLPLIRLCALLRRVGYEIP